MEDTKKGWVYVALNDFMPNVVKIGFTTDLKQRVKTLGGANVPDDFNYFHTRFFEDCRKAEKTVHQILDKYRVPSGKEFFSVEPSLAMQIIDKVFLEEKLEKYDQILHHLEEKTENLEEKLDEYEQNQQDLEDKIEDLEQKTEQQNEQIQKLKSEINFQNDEFNFLFKEFVLKDLKEQKILGKQIEFLINALAVKLAESRLLIRIGNRNTSSKVLSEINSLGKDLTTLKVKSEIIIKITEEFLEKNPDEFLSKKLDELKAQIQKINEQSEKDLFDIN